MKAVWLVLLIVLCSCGPRKEKHWPDPARDKVDVDVTPKEKRR